MPQITFTNVTYTFPNDAVALDDVSCAIEPGEFVFLVGPSGAGKTTFLRLLIREILPTQGSIFFEEEEISKKRGVSPEKIRQKVGVSFQDDKLLVDRTVEENIALAMEIVGKKEKEIKESVHAVLDLVGLTDKAEMFPAQLSGGELQRIGIARAVVGDPILIFADEPTANLDEESMWKIISLLKEINRSGKTTIVATHNLDVIRSLGERVLHLDKGKLVKDEKPVKSKKEKK